MMCPSCDTPNLEREETEDDVRYYCTYCGYDSH